MHAIFPARTHFAGPRHRLGPSLAVAGGLAWLAGCTFSASHQASAPPPASAAVGAPAPVAVTGAATPSAAGTVIVPQAPPALEPEVAQPRPSSAHVWVAGYWAWRDNRYDWVAGHWEVPPRTDAVWVAPRWERLSDGGYRFYEGAWN